MPDTALIALSIASRSHGVAPTLPSFRGFLMAMEDAKKREDLPAPIDWVIIDDHAIEGQARLLAQTVVADERIIGVVGPMGSTEAFENAPVFSQAGLLQVSPCASHPTLTQQGYGTFYRLVPNETVQGHALAVLAREKLEAESVAIVHDNDAFGTTVSENFRNSFSGIGGKVLAIQAFEAGAQDFSDLADRVAATEPDIVFFAVHAREGSLVSSAIRERGVDVPFLGTDGMKTSFFLGGGDTGHEAYHTHSGADFRRLETAKAFRDEYVERWPEDSTYSPEGYDSAMLIVEALARAGEVSRSSVADAFRSLGTYQGITGDISFDENGERVDAPVSWYRVSRHSGERVMEYQGTVA